MVRLNPVIRAVLEASGTHLNADGAKVLDFYTDLCLPETMAVIDYQVINRSEADSNFQD